MPLSKAFFTSSKARRPKPSTLSLQLRRQPEHWPGQHGEVAFKITAAGIVDREEIVANLYAQRKPLALAVDLHAATNEASPPVTAVDGDNTATDVGVEIDFHRFFLVLVGTCLGHDKGSIEEPHIFVGETLSQEAGAVDGGAAVTKVGGQPQGGGEVDGETQPCHKAVIELVSDVITKVGRYFETKIKSYFLIKQGM